MFAILPKLLFLLAATSEAVSALPDYENMPFKVNFQGFPPNEAYLPGDQINTTTGSVKVVSSGPAGAATTTGNGISLISGGGLQTMGNVSGFGVKFASPVAVTISDNHDAISVTISDNHDIIAVAIDNSHHPEVAVTISDNHDVIEVTISDNHDIIAVAIDNSHHPVAPGSHIEIAEIAYSN